MDRFIPPMEQIAGELVRPPEHPKPERIHSGGYHTIPPQRWNSGEFGIWE
jgi:hypothetical protein